MYFVQITIMCHINVLFAMQKMNQSLHTVQSNYLYLEIYHYCGVVWQKEASDIPSKYDEVVIMLHCVLFFQNKFYAYKHSSCYMLGTT